MAIGNLARCVWVCQPGVLSPVFGVFRVFSVMFGLPVSAVFGILCGLCIPCILRVLCILCIPCVLCCVWVRLPNAYSVFCCVRVGQLCCGELCAGGEVGSGE